MAHLSIKRIDDDIYAVDKNTVLCFSLDDDGWYLDQEWRVSQVFTFSWEALDAYQAGTVEWENI
jgi:hypothetical protein